MVNWLFVGAALAAKLLSSALKDLLHEDVWFFVGATSAAKLFYSALKDLLPNPVFFCILCGEKLPLLTCHYLQASSFYPLLHHL